MDKTYDILLVDDDEFLLDIYSRKFKQAGHAVHSAHGGEEALEYLAGNPKVDIVLMDIVMPSMSGLELLQAIRDKGYAKGAKLIVLSNQGQESDIKEAENHKVDGYIVKASTIPSEVLEKVVAIASQV